MGDGADDAEDQALDEWLEGGGEDDDCDVSFDYYYRKSSTPSNCWRTRDGQIIAIKELKTSHLCNILNFLERTREMNGLRSDKQKALEKEARTRNIFFDSVRGQWKISTEEVAKESAINKLWNTVVNFPSSLYIIS